MTGGGVASGAGNVLVGGIIGIGVDAGTGANLDLRRNPMKARLAPIDSGQDPVTLSEDQLEAEEKAAKAAKDAPAAATVEPGAAANQTPAAEAPAPAEAMTAPEVLTMDPVDSSDDAATRMRQKSRHRRIRTQTAP